MNDPGSSEQTQTIEGGEAAQTQPSEPVSTGAQGGAGDAPPASEPFRFGTGGDVPTWAQGKTAEEVLRTAQDLYDALQTSAPARPAQPASFAPDPSSFNTPNLQHSTMNPPSGIPEPDPNLIYTDAAAYTRQLRDAIRAEMRAEMSQAAAGITTPLASMARAQAAQNPKRKVVWEKWGPEIEAIVAKLPPEAKARPDIWDEAARMVAGEHAEELAQMKAEEIIRARMDSGMLSTQGGPPSPGADAGRGPLAKLFADKDPAVKGFLDDGIPLAKVKEHYAKRGYTKEEDIVALLTARTRKAGAR